MNYNNSRWEIYFIPDDQDEPLEYVDTILAANKDEAAIIFELMINTQKWKFKNREGAYMLQDEFDIQLYECRIKGEILH